MDFTQDMFEDQDVGDAKQDLFTFANPDILNFDFGAQPENIDEGAKPEYIDKGAEPEYIDEGAEPEYSKEQANINEQEDNLAVASSTLPTGDDERAVLDPKVAAADAADAALDQQEEGKKIIVKGL